MGGVGRAPEVRAVDAMAAHVTVVRAALAAVVRAALAAVVRAAPAAVARAALAAVVRAALAAVVRAAPAAGVRVEAELVVEAEPVTAVTAPGLGVLVPVMGAMVPVALVLLVTVATGRLVAAPRVAGAVVPRRDAVRVPQVGLVEPVAVRPDLMKADARPAEEVRVVRRVDRVVRRAARVVRVVTGGSVVHRAPARTVRAALVRRALRATTPVHRARGHIPSGSQLRISRMTSRRRSSIGRRAPACGPWPRTTRTA